MIQFDDDEPGSEARLQHEWNTANIHPEIRRVAQDLDQFLILGGRADLVVTSLIRERNPAKPSFHEIGQAADVRNRDWNRIMRGAIHYRLQSLAALLSTEKAELQWLWEKDHLHIEWDDNNALIKGGADGSANS